LETKTVVITLVEDLDAEAEAEGGLAAPTPAPTPTPILSCVGAVGGHPHHRLVSGEGTPPPVTPGALCETVSRMTLNTHQTLTASNEGDMAHFQGLVGASSSPLPAEGAGGGAGALPGFFETDLPTMEAEYGVVYEN